MSSLSFARPKDKWKKTSIFLFGPISMCGQMSIPSLTAYCLKDFMNLGHRQKYLEVLALSKLENKNFELLIPPKVLLFC